MNPIIHATIAMLAVINPVVCGTMVLKLGKSQSKRDRVLLGIKAMGAVLLILLIAALAGKSILGAFGISMEAFHVVGGIILAFIGFQLLGGGKAAADDSHQDEQGMTPLILFAASPGTISMVITLSVTKGGALPMSTMLGSTIAVLITIGIITLMQLIAKGGDSNGQGIFSRFMGLIVVAMGLQFLLDGLKNFFQ